MAWQLGYRNKFLSWQEHHNQKTNYVHVNKIVNHNYDCKIYLWQSTQKQTDSHGVIMSLRADNGLSRSCCPTALKFCTEHGSIIAVLARCKRWKHQSSASLAFVRGINRWPVNSPHKWPVTWKMFPFDDVIMKGYGQTRFREIWV